MLKQLRKKVIEHYFKHNQWLDFQSLYEDNDGIDTEQWLCLRESNDKHCIVCIEIQTFSNLPFDEVSYQPYMIYEPDYHTFRICVPKFGNLTKEDIKKAVKFVVRENFLTCFNIKIDGNSLEDYVTDIRISKEARWTENFKVPSLSEDV